jgi:hypothetical protein
MYDDPVLGFLDHHQNKKILVISAAFHVNSHFTWIMDVLMLKPSWQDVVHKPFEVSPFVAVTEKGFEKEPEAFLLFDKLPNRQKIQSESSSIRGSVFEKEVPAKDTSAGLARIKVVVSSSMLFLI